MAAATITRVAPTQTHGNVLADEVQLLYWQLDWAVTAPVLGDSAAAITMASIASPRAPGTIDLRMYGLGMTGNHS